MKLNKLKMPSKGAGKELSDRLGEMSMMDEGDMSDEGESEQPEEAPKDEMMEEDSEDISELRDIPDEELLAELRRRGLSAKASMASKKPSKDGEYL